MNVSPYLPELPGATVAALPGADGAPVPGSLATSSAAVSGVSVTVFVTTNLLSATPASSVAGRRAAGALLIGGQRDTREHRRDLVLWSPLFLIWGLLWAATALTYARRAKTTRAQDR
jgi:hypothetical protein